MRLPMYIPSSNVHSTIFPSSFPLFLFGTLCFLTLAPPFSPFSTSSSSSLCRFAAATSVPSQQPPYLGLGLSSDQEQQLIEPTVPPPLTLANLTNISTLNSAAKNYTFDIALFTAQAGGQIISDETTLGFQMAVNDTLSILPTGYRIRLRHIYSDDCSLATAMSTMWVADTTSALTTTDSASVVPVLAVIGDGCNPGPSLSVLATSLGIPTLTYSVEMDGEDTYINPDLGSSAASSIFYMSQGASHEATFLANVVNWLGTKSMAVLTATELFSENLGEFFCSQVTRMGMQIALRQVFSNSGELPGALAIVKDMNVQVIVAIARNCDDIIHNALAAGLLQKGYVWIANYRCIKNANVTTRILLNTTVYSRPVVYTALSTMFQSKFRQMLGRDPSDPSAGLVYDSVVAVSRAIAGVRSKNGTVTGRTVASELNTMSFTGITGQVAFDAHGARAGASSDLVIQRVIEAAARAPAYVTQIIGRVWFDTPESLRIVLDGTSVSALWQALSGERNSDRIIQAPVVDDTLTPRSTAEGGVPPWVWGLLGVLVTVVFALIGLFAFKFYRWTRKRATRQNLGSVRLAEECAQAIPRLDFRSLEWVVAIVDPDPIQRSFMQIVQVLKNVRPYVSDALRQTLAVQNEPTPAEVEPEGSVAVPIGPIPRNGTQDFDGLEGAGGGGGGPPSTSRRIDNDARSVDEQSMISSVNESAWVTRTMVVLVGRFSFPTSLTPGIAAACCADVDFAVARNFGGGVGRKSSSAHRYGHTTTSGSSTGSCSTLDPHLDSVNEGAPPGPVLGKTIVEEVHVNMMNAVVRAVKHNKGVLEHFSPCTTVAHWGAIRETAEASRLACQAAVEMHQRIKAVSKDIQCTIGLALGECSVGSVSNVHYGTFMVIGSAMSLAWKFSDPLLHAPLGSWVLCNHALVSEVRRYFRFRLVHIYDADDSPPCPLYDLDTRRPYLEDDEDENANPAGGVRKDQVQQMPLENAMWAYYHKRYDEANTLLIQYQAKYGDSKPASVLATQLALVGYADEEDAR